MNNSTEWDYYYDYDTLVKEYEEYMAGLEAQRQKEMVLPRIGIGLCTVGLIVNLIVFIGILR